MTDQQKLLMSIGIAAVNKMVANERLMRIESNEKRERTDLRQIYLDIEKREQKLTKLYLELYGNRMPS